MRLIDADKWIADLKAIVQDKSAPGAMKDYAMFFISQINTQPTAYDVDKVCGVLSELMIQAEKGMQLSDVYAEAQSYGGLYIGYEKAMEIVKTGGVNEAT